VEQGKPSTQVTRRLVRRLAVERHQCRAAAGNTGDLGAPLVKANAGYLDEVFATVDDLFETMHGVSSSFTNVMCWNRGILAARGIGSSESRIEGASTQCNVGDLLPFTAKINLGARLLNRASTIVQQLFNKWRS
jgi:hypothetical protein